MLNPLQMRIGPSRGGSLRGAVVGNIAVVAACILLMVGVSACYSCCCQQQRVPLPLCHDAPDRSSAATRRSTSSTSVHRRDAFGYMLAKGFRFPGVVLAPFSILLVPIGTTVAAALFRLIADGGSDDTVLANVLLALLPIALVVVGNVSIVYIVVVQFQARFAPRQSMTDGSPAAAFTTQSYDSFLSTAVLRCARQFHAGALVETRGDWVNAPTKTSTRRISFFVERFGFIFEGSRSGRQWYVLLDCAIAAAVNLIDGLQPFAAASSEVGGGGSRGSGDGMDSGSPDCSPHLIALCLCSVIQCVLCSILRPSRARIENMFSTLTGVVGALAAGIGAADVPGSSELFDVLMWIGLLQLVVAIYAGATAGNVSAAMRRWGGVFCSARTPDDAPIQSVHELQVPLPQAEPVRQRAASRILGRKRISVDHTIVMPPEEQEVNINVLDGFAPPPTTKPSAVTAYRLRRGPAAVAATSSYTNIVAGATAEQAFHALRTISLYVVMYEGRNISAMPSHTAIHEPSLEDLVLAACWRGIRHMTRSREHATMTTGLSTTDLMTKHA
jgi:hypothetical protein